MVLGAGRSPADVKTLGLESLILFVSDLQASKAFYADGLGLSVLVNKGDILALVRSEEEGSRAVVPAWL